MTSFNLEENKLLNSVENNEWKTINNLENMKQIYQNYALIQVNQEIDEDDEPTEKILENLRQSLQDVKEGRTHDISEL
jgi:SepF-like predicted cell division protein (DUF552 family)